MRGLLFEIRTSQEALEKCDIKGQLLPRAEINIEEITALLELSEGDVEAGNKLMEGLEKSSVLWGNITAKKQAKKILCQ